MINAEKKIIIQNLASHNTPVAESYYRLLNYIDDNKIDYDSYMITAPIDCEEELKRLPNADYDLSCALLTMLVREDHFCNGSFEKRYKKEQVKPILKRMIELLD